MEQLTDFQDVAKVVFFYRHTQHEEWTLLNVQ